jgi:mannose-6-phosphate isomerase-like protein (cupin superfamily)
MHIPYESIRARLRVMAGDCTPARSLLVEAMRRGTMSLEFYAPVGEDRQQPHRQDELYIVQLGSAVLELEGEDFGLSAGDAIFVAAGARHRFRSFTEGFGTWVVFFDSGGQGTPGRPQVP